MGQEYSVLSAEISPASRQELVKIKYETMPGVFGEIETRIWKYSNQAVYFQSGTTKYVVPIKAIRYSNASSVVVKLILTKSFIDDPVDAPVLHYHHCCELCHAPSDEDHAFYVNGPRSSVLRPGVKLLSGVRQCIGRPSEEGYKTLGLTVYYPGFTIEPYRAFKIKHSVYGERYLIFERSGKYYHINNHHFRCFNEILNPILKSDNLSREHSFTGWVQPEPKIKYNKHGQEELHDSVLFAVAENGDDNPVGTGTIAWCQNAYRFIGSGLILARKPKQEIVRFAELRF